MFALIDEAGKFLAGRVLSEADTSAQIELDSGKRLKVKKANVLLRFDQPSPAELMRAALAVAESIDLHLAWEFAPEDEFGFADLARDYFSERATTVQQAGALFRLFEAPHYFRRAGKGRFRRAPAEIVEQALLAIEKKRQVQALIGEWALELGQGRCPEPVREQLYKILFRPDKNAPEYKAVVQAARETQSPVLALLVRAGAIDSAYQFHWRRFLFDHFPKGIQHPGLQAPAIEDPLPLAEVQAYSIDDSQTTEIDDALSLRGVGTGVLTLGIHIAAPALALRADDAISQAARRRMSTVYMPGYKITMLPDDVVQTYTLQEGRDCPAVSLYVSFDEASLAIQSSYTRLERVPIAANLRHDQLDTLVTPEWLEDASLANEPVGSTGGLQQQTLSVLYGLAKHLKAQREVVRGKPETFNRPDYNFRLSGNDSAEPDGSEEVQISIRQRGAPLDLIVAEAMILANSTWGAWLHSHGVPGIYRSQASLAPGVKVRMGTKALPHAGIGVKSYAWSTSPLRRYADLVNQWQIIACARFGQTAALAAPFKPRDADLFAIISGFDEAYAAYSGYQAGMERFWTLRYLHQRNITELTATVFKEGPNNSMLARTDDLPLVLPILGVQLPRGAHVRIRLGAIDELALDVSATLIERLDSAADAQPGDASDDEALDDETVAGPLTIAVDMAGDMAVDAADEIAPSAANGAGDIGAAPQDKAPEITAP